MSLNAILASPMPSLRRPGRPGLADTSDRADHLRALRCRVTYGLAEIETARLLGVSRMTVYRWRKKAMTYPEAHQIIDGDTLEISI